MFILGHDHVNDFVIYSLLCCKKWFWSSNSDLISFKIVFVICGTIFQYFLYMYRSYKYVALLKHHLFISLCESLLECSTIC